MKLPRVSIAALMGLVVLVAVGFAALKNPTELWAGSLFLATLGLLLLSLAGAAFRRGNSQLRWAGFAVFGFGYLILTLSTGAFKPPYLPTTFVLEYLFKRINPSQTLTQSNSVAIIGQITLTTPNTVQGHFSFFQIGHCLMTLVIALFGSVVVLVFVRHDGTHATKHP